MRSFLSPLTMAEYFRDDEHRDVLLLIDNIFRFIQADFPLCLSEIKLAHTDDEVRREMA